MDIYSGIESVKGIGPKTKEQFNNCLIFNVLDLLLYFPRTYEFVNAQSGEAGSKNGNVIITVEAVEIKRDIRTKTGKILTTIVFDDGEKFMEVKWFNQPYVKNCFKLNCQYTLMGKLQDYRGKTTLVNPKVIKEAVTEETKEKIIPKYPLKGALKNSTVLKAVETVLKEVSIQENLPEHIMSEYEFSSLDEAMRNIHMPQDGKKLQEAVKRLKFQELFTYSLKVLMLKRYRETDKEGIAFSMSPRLKELKDGLPFPLTSAQSRVVREILLDQKKAAPMNRLVQGDVGSGKTIVSIISMFNVMENGYQAVMMAPTEILAMQHYDEIKKILGKYDFEMELLSGSLTKKKKQQVKERLKNGEIDIVVGTHALLEEDVEFENLGLVVTDEQHRFGVMQRSKLMNKGKNVDVLVMSATPIPRTLSLYLYGDLDVSIIDELPPGRQKIDTHYINQERKDRVYGFAMEQIREGRQVYIVCPLVEENEELKLNSVEKLFDELKESYFQDVSTEILHGKMKPKEKDAIMERFKNGETKVLVSTTVIEVGINVPNATVMIVENAERFGLAQLHQLRGRVGRGVHKSYCMLIANMKNDIIRKRMDIMKSSNDGFYIAEQDLKIRGTGELFGMRQHGDDGLVLSDVVEDMELLKKANAEAKKIITSHSEEDEKMVEYILKKIEQTSKFISFN